MRPAGPYAKFVRVRPSLAGRGQVARPSRAAGVGGRGGGAVGLGPAVGRRVLLKNPGWGWRGAGGGRPLGMGSIHPDLAAVQRLRGCICCIC